MNAADRYSRQLRFEPIGRAGHERIRAGSAAVVGAGALGSSIANALVRAGIGRLLIIDPDRLQWSNLQRQTLYDERQVERGMNKAEAACQRLRAINADVDLVAVPERLTRDNIAGLLAGFDLVLDGCDNFESRFLINDFCVRERLPWIHGGCAGGHGQSLTVIPEQTPCLRCLFDAPSSSVRGQTADTVGILGPIAHLVAALQAGAALKILSGNASAVRAVMHTVDLWEDSLRSINLQGPDPDCPCCGQRRFDFLNKGPTP